MKIQIIKCLQDNYSYLIVDETNLNACVVDPSESKPIINFVESNNITLKYILNTHHHFDHVGGNIELKKRYKEISQRRVRLAILLQYIAKEKKITVDEKELSQGMMQYATQYPGQEKEIIEYFKKNPSSIETIRGPILEEKVIKNISSQCNSVKTKLNKNEYEKLEKEVFEIKKE